MIAPNGEFATDAVAYAAIASPVWLPWLQTTSTTAAMLVPILGGLWLFVQIVRALINGWISYRDWLKSKQPGESK